MAGQSTPDMSATQKWSRCRRHTSRSICRHSSRGSTDTRMRPRSIQPLLREGASPTSSRRSSRWSTAMARQRLPSRTSSVWWSAPSAKSSALAISVSARCVSKSKTSSRPLPSLWPPRPCWPSIGSTVHSTLPCAAPASLPKRLSATGKAAMRCAMPCRSMRSGAVAAVGLGAAPCRRPSARAAAASKGAVPPACSATR